MNKKNKPEEMGLGQGRRWGRLGKGSTAERPERRWRGARGRGSSTATLGRRLEKATAVGRAAARGRRRRHGEGSKRAGPEGAAPRRLAVEVGEAPRRPGDATSTVAGGRRDVDGGARRSTTAACEKDGEYELGLDGGGGASWRGVGAPRAAAERQHNGGAARRRGGAGLHRRGASAASGSSSCSIWGKLRKISAKDTQNRAESTFSRDWWLQVSLGRQNSGAKPRGTSSRGCWLQPRLVGLFLFFCCFCFLFLF